MLLSNLRPDVRKILQCGLFSGLLMLPLTGCFRPVYGDVGTSGNSVVQDQLKTITITPIAERNGHYVYNALVERLNGTGENPDPKYRLTVKLNQGVSTVIVDYFSGGATSSDIIINASFDLIEIKTGKAIIRDTVSQSHAYDRGGQRYANISAARTAEIDDAKDIAEQIADRVAVSLSTLNNHGTVAEPSTVKQVLPSSLPVPSAVDDDTNKSPTPTPTNPFPTPW